MHRALRSAAAPALAILGGLALWLSFPDFNLWWLTPVGVALIGAALLRAGFRRGFLLGLLAGWAFFIPVLSWSGVYVGAVPWVALATMEAGYVAVMGGLVGWAGRRLLDDPTPGRTLAAYALIPLGWVAQELARGTTPWGGFPWARLAFSQADSPLLGIAAWLGAPGVTAAVAVIGMLLLAGVTALSLARIPALGASVAAVVAVGVLAAVIPRPTDGRPVTVGFVQGNVPHAGLDFNAERRAVLDNHVNGTLTLASEGLADASLVVWPENSSDIDPFRNADARAQIDRAVDATGVPVLVGAVLAEPVDHNSNVSLLYRPGEETPERYTKLHPVPFAEYIPYRSFFAWFDETANLAGNFVAGSQIGAFEIPADGGSYWALPTICFEVAYDGLMRDAVLQDGKEASLLVVQTNNATFGYTAESEQQFAISRLRAVEHGRSVLHVSTVGVSGLIHPDGSVTAKTGLFTAEQRLVAPVIRRDITLSDRLGPWPERAAVAAFLGLLLFAARRPSASATTTRVKTAKAPTSKDHAVA